MCQVSRRSWHLWTSDSQHGESLGQVPLSLMCLTRARVDVWWYRKVWECVLQPTKYCISVRGLQTKSCWHIGVRCEPVTYFQTLRHDLTPGYLLWKQSCNTKFNQRAAASLHRFHYSKTLHLCLRSKTRYHLFKYKGASLVNRKVKFCITLTRRGCHILRVRNPMDIRLRDVSAEPGQYKSA